MIGLRQLKTLRKNTFLMNALFLMLSTFVVAAAGFLFWVVVTRTYDVAAVGLATTLLSVSGLLSLLGLAGFDTTFVRFLPRSNRKNDYINSGFIIVTIASSALAIIAALALPFISPSFAFLTGAGAFFSFVFFTAVTALNTVTNAVFLAYKQARYIFIINAIFSGCKVFLPLLAAGGDAMTIFVIAGVAQLVGLGLSIWWMQRKFNYTFSLKIHLDIMRIVRKFSASAYASSVLNLLPPTLLPLLIVFYMGPKQAAYYYMAFTIASVLYTIAYASMQSVFAEGSHDEAAMRAHVGKAAKLIVALLVPAAIATALVSNVLLTTFGDQYAQGASALLQLFAIGALPVALYSAMGAVFKVTKNLRGMVGMNIVYSAGILGLSFLLVPQFGLIAVGWAWLIGNSAACITGTFFLRHNNR